MEKYSKRLFTISGGIINEERLRFLNRTSFR